MMVRTLTGNNIEIEPTPKFENWIDNFTPASDGKFRLVYLTRNLINDKVYVGQHTTKNFTDKYKGSGSILLQAIKKYGTENFKTRFCCFCETADDLNDAEIYWIAYFESIESGYNICKGGSNLSEIAERNRRNGIKLAIDEGRRNILKGDEHPKYWLGKKGEDHPRYHILHTADTCQKMKDNHADFSGENNPNFGKVGELNALYEKPLPQEHKDKIKIALTGKKKSDEHIKVMKENGKIQFENRPILTCPYCGLSSKGVRMKFDHFENCKHKDNVK